MFVILDSAFFERLTAPTDCQEFHYEDVETPGLSLEIDENGVMVFEFNYRDEGGIPRRYTIGQYPRVSIHLARREVNRILDDQITGHIPENMNIPDRFPPQVREAMQLARLEIGDAMDLPSYCIEFDGCCSPWGTSSLINFG